MARKKTIIEPEADLIYNNNYDMEISHTLDLYMTPNIDLIKLSPSDNSISHPGNMSVRKIEVNGEKTLINTRQDDPNP
ncbi:hypothetical protein [Abyssisolibacter fermentans]|uniref:hypothetical protein n=1 Tax=Abyssisolibacter fermentans TaxID=1766203 RepID=UPI00082A4B2C|nr:hypothetical protein [Abyssisolibacter fermentans]